MLPGGFVCPPEETVSNLVDVGSIVFNQIFFILLAFLLGLDTVSGYHLRTRKGKVGLLLSTPSIVTQIAIHIFKIILKIKLINRNSSDVYPHTLRNSFFIC